MSEILRLERREILEREVIGTVSTALNGNILRADQRFADIFGFNLVELPGRLLLDMAVPEHRAACEESFGRVTNGHTGAVSLEKRFARKDGSLVWLRMTATLQRDLEGRPL